MYIGKIVIPEYFVSIFIGVWKTVLPNCRDIVVEAFDPFVEGFRDSAGYREANILRFKRRCFFIQITCTEPSVVKLQKLLHNKLKQRTKIIHKYCCYWKRHGQVFEAPGSCDRSGTFRPGWFLQRVLLFHTKRTYSPWLFTQVYKWVPANRKEC